MNSEMDRCPKLELILTISAQGYSALGGDFVQVSDGPLGAHWLSVVWSREVSISLRFQMYYFYRKCNWGHGIFLL